MKTDIQNREDISKLVLSFYAKVRKDNILGPFFNNAIKDWDTHLDRLTTFWESSLFITKKLEHKYYGNPLETHIKVDKNNKHNITQEHFGLWLNLWFQTIDKLFIGDNANKAKTRARKMGTFLYLKIFEARQT